MKLFLTCLLSLIVTCASTFAQQQTIDQINAKAVPLDSEKSLKAIAAAAKNAEILGLGEASHGTHEFNTERKRIIEYLIKHENYKAVGLEFGYTPIDKINTFLQTGKGDLKTLTQQLRLYGTKEMLDLLQSLKTYNDSQPAGKKVTLFGFDTDYFTEDITASAKYCTDYLSKNPKLTDNTDAALDALKSITAPNFEQLYSLPDADVAALKALHNQIKSKANNTAPGFAEFKKRISLLYQGTTLGNPLARDEFMAQNLTDIQQNSKAKTIIIGHNMHLAKDTTMAQCRAMGYYTRKNYGDKYYAVAFDTYKGKVTVLAGDDFEQHDFETATTSYSALFAGAKLPAYFLAFGKDGAPLQATVANDITNIYANWNMRRALPMRPAADFDAVIFIRETTATTPLK